jgi:hypothetical protein
MAVMTIATVLSVKVEVARIFWSKRVSAKWASSKKAQAIPFPTQH